MPMQQKSFNFDGYTFNLKTTDMKKLVLMCLLAVLTTATFAQKQEKQLTGKEKKEIKKQQKKALEEEMAKSLKIAIDSQQWVLEATSLADKKGMTIQVQSSLNFVAMTGEEVFIQLGSNTGMGANGVGGVSLSTKVSKYEVTQNQKNGNYYIKLYANSSVGNFTIFVDSDATGQMVSATVQGNTSSKVQYRGQLVPTSKSSVYKGRAIY
jgi:cellobiose-specific phosphotransferase system component IIB